MIGTAELAWEFLRRNSDYIRCWKRHCDLKSICCDLCLKRWGLLSFSDPDEDNMFLINWDYLRFHKAVYFVQASSFYSKNGNSVIDLSSPGEIYDRMTESRCSKLWMKDGCVLELIYPEGSQPGYDTGCFFLPFDCNTKRQAKLTKYVSFFLEGKKTSVIDTKKYEELLKIHDLRLRGKSQKDIARILYGDQSVELNWDSDSSIRASIRYKYRKSEETIASKYLEILAV